MGPPGGPKHASAAHMQRGGLSGPREHCGKRALWARGGRDTGEGRSVATAHRRAAQGFGRAGGRVGVWARSRRQAHGVSSRKTGPTHGMLVRCVSIWGVLGLTKGRWSAGAGGQTAAGPQRCSSW